MQGLFVFGECDFSHLIKADSYSITPNARQDLDSYRDEQGILRRNALTHTATIVEFDTIPMWDNKMQTLLSQLNDSYWGKNYYERKATARYFDPENGTMKSGDFYLDSNFKLSIKQVWGGKILYDSCHFKFVEY